MTTKTEKIMNTNWWNGRHPITGETVEITMFFNPKVSDVGGMENRHRVV